MAYLNHFSRRNFIYSATCSICGSLLLPSCTEIPLTNRKQFNYYSYNLPIITIDNLFGLPIPKIYANEQSLNNQCEKDYKKLISKAREKNILIENTKDSKLIKDIGTDIFQSIDKYYLNINETSPVKNFNWEFALLDEKNRDGELIKNAWCMPGGKVAFFTGILPIAKNDDGIASIMGHEIAHAFARHGVESLTRYSTIQLGTIAISQNEKARNILNKTYNLLGSNRSIYNDVINYGVLLPFSRTMESEADYMGLTFMSLSGFNTQESYKVWERMQVSENSDYPPEFTTSHPSPDNRIKKLKEWIPIVKAQYPAIKS